MKVREPPADVGLRVGAGAGRVWCQQLADFCSNLGLKRGALLISIRALEIGVLHKAIIDENF